MTPDFNILGAVEVLQQGEGVDLGSPRQRALLVRLLIDVPRVISADRLIEDLWPGDQPQTARHALHVYISGIRKSLGVDRDRLERVGHGYHLRVEDDEVDSIRFERNLTEGRAALVRGDPQMAADLLASALDMWRGPALADVRDEPFAREEVTRLENLRLDAQEEQMWADLELGRHGEVAAELQDRVARHPYREVFWEQLMLALYRSGRQADALRTYQSARDQLAEALGVEPGPALQHMEERILAHDPALLLQPRSGSALRLVPRPRTSFIGRQREIKQAIELLEHARLLTLTGAPGSGKTRLALQVADDITDRFPHGTFFVPLAATDDAGLVGSEIGRALELPEPEEDLSAWDAVEAYFAPRCAMLVLDNFEQILDAAPQVGRLLDAARDLTIVVTSRASLGLSGEQEFRVPPLALPPPGERDPHEVSSYDAVLLFTARARAVDPGFTLDAGNAGAVADVTTMVDGLPLAIELAAARVALLSPRDLVERLERRLNLLTGGPADSVGRHHTMRDAIAWSHDLLEASEQVMYRRLGVFRGGFTLDAAADVVGIDEDSAINGLDSLRSKGLIYRKTDAGGARLAMLEMLREFASEALVAAGEERDVGRRHAEHYLRLAAEVEPELTREPRGWGVDRLASEVDNLRCALGFALSSGEPNLGLALASHLWRFWQSTDQLVEGKDWLGKLLAHSDASPQSRAHGLVALAGLTYWQGDYEETLRHYQEALDLFRTVGDRLNEAETLYSMSLTANWKQDLDAGEGYAEAAGTVYEELDSQEGIGKVLMARAFVLWRRGELEAAHKLWLESLSIARDSGDQTMAVSQLVGLAALTFHLGDRTEALRIVLEGVEEAVGLHNTHLIVWLLDFVAAYAAPEFPEPAVELAGAVDVLRKKAGGGILPVAIGVEDARSVGSRLLEPAALAAALERGRQMDVEEAVAVSRSFNLLMH